MKKQISVAIFIILSFNISAFPSVIDTTRIVGSAQGVFSVSLSGASTYTIPVFASPGTGGMSPQLSIDYNSCSGEGLFGKDFHLKGLTSIYRVVTPYYMNGVVKAIDMDSDDLFALDGNYLISATGAYGGDNSTYKTESETFATIISHGTSGPAWFEVIMKDGTVIEYGNASNSKVVDDNSRAIVWNVTMITDVHGNYISFNYGYNYSIGQSFLESIHYTGNNSENLIPYNEIAFSYETRQNKNQVFFPGGETPQKLLINKIEVICDDTLVRRYDFDYNTNFYTKLVEISESAGDGSSFNNSRFQWGTNSLPSTRLVDAGSVTTSDKRIFTGDFNGDGKPDYITMAKKTIYSTSDVWKLYLYNEDIDDYVNTDSGVLNSAFIGIVVFDYDADGDDDTYWQYRSTYYEDFKYYELDGVELVNVSARNYRYNTSANNVGYCIPGDFDGDGDIDRMFVNYSGGYYSSGTIQGINIQGQHFLSFSGVRNVSVIDFNGNGKSDILTENNGVFKIYEYVKYDEDFRILVSYYYNSYNDEYYSGDFNGDGKTDLLLVDKYSIPDSIRTRIAFSDGETFHSVQGPISIYSFVGQPVGGEPPLGGEPEPITYYEELSLQLFVHDFNRDGKTDIFKSLYIKEATGIPGEAMTYTDILTEDMYISTGLQFKTESIYSGAQKPRYSNLLDNNFDGTTDLLIMMNNGGDKVLEFYPGDKRGLIVETTEPGGTIQYAYNPDGKVTSITSPSGTTVITYDQYGFQDELIDIDAGITDYDYNIYGELIRQTDAEGNVVDMEYDPLGRLTKVARLGGDTITYTYNSSSSYLTSILSTNGSEHTFTYDSLFRVASKSERIEPGNIFTAQYSYLANGDISSAGFNNFATISYNYNNYGYLNQVNLEVSSSLTTIWQANSMNQYGIIDNYDLGNGVNTTISFDQYGYLDKIESVKGTIQIQDWDYDFSSTFGNIVKRKGLNSSGTYNEEYFTYDSQDRLITAVIGTDTLSLTYDSGGLGNIISKRDVGTFCYNPTYVHRLDSITDRTPIIENLPTQNITYTKFNKINTVSVSDGILNKNLSITYGPDQRRIKTIQEENSVTRLTKYFALGSYEKEVDTVKGTRELYYIYTPSGLSAILESKTGGDSIFYIHSDILGSFDVITNSSGTAEEWLSFDPWGRRRSTDDWDFDTFNTEFRFDRGFTGHQHLDDFGIINMNGRVYDPLLAMFLSPDPFIQSPGNVQNYNRYTYCLNNPLKYIDPTGYKRGWLKDFLKRIFNGGGSSSIPESTTGDNPEIDYGGNSASFENSDWENAFVIPEVVVNPEKPIRWRAKDAVMATNGRGQAWYSIYNWSGLSSSARTMDAIYAGDYLNAAGWFLVCAGEVFTLGKASTINFGAKTTVVASKGVSNLATHSDIVIKGGRSGQLLKNATGPANSVVKGGVEGRVLITNQQGQVIWDITRERAKSVIPGQGFGPKVAPTQEQLNLIKRIWGN